MIRSHSGFSNTRLIIASSSAVGGTSKSENDRSTSISFPLFRSTQQYIGTFHYSVSFKYRFLAEATIYATPKTAKASRTVTRTTAPVIHLKRDFHIRNHPRHLLRLSIRITLYELFQVRAVLHRLNLVVSR